MLLLNSKCPCVNFKMKKCHIGLHFLARVVMNLHSSVLLACNRPTLVSKAWLNYFCGHFETDCQSLAPISWYIFHWYYIDFREILGLFTKDCISCSNLGMPVVHPNLPQDMEEPEEQSQFLSDQLRLQTQLSVWLYSNQQELRVPAKFETDFSCTVFPSRSCANRVSAEVMCNLCSPPHRLMLQGGYHRSHNSWNAFVFQDHMRKKHFRNPFAGYRPAKFSANFPQSLTWQ